MINEIGSEYWLESTPRNGSGVSCLMPSGYNNEYTLSGRTALDIIVKDILKCHVLPLKVYMPSYCCHTMIEPFLSNGLNVIFYEIVVTEGKIEKRFDENNECDIVYLLDYFGFIDLNTIRIAQNQKKKRKILVYDATHSIMCDALDYSYYDYVYGSFRKWFGVNAGFCSKYDIWIDFPSLSINNKYSDLRNESFHAKAEYMSNKSSGKSIYLSGFKQAELMLEKDYCNFYPDEQSKEILNDVNIRYIQDRRKDNSKLILSKIQCDNINLIYSKIEQSDCPLFIPILLKKERRKFIQTELIKRRIYFPIHWPISSFHKLNSLSELLFYTELSCVCDQRYSKEEIAYMINNVTDVIEKC